jgi:serine/threonine-protein kinase RsbW
VEDEGMAAGQGPEEVRLSVPATPEYLRLARITGSGLASRLGFTYDEVEDLRLALDELCFALVGTDGRAGTLEVRYTTTGKAIEVEGTLVGTGSTLAPSLSDLGDQILSALVDDHAVRPASQRPSIWLRKVRAG